MTEAPVVFGNTVEGMLRNALAGRMTPALEQRLRDLGLDVSAPIAAAYPYPEWKKWSEAIASEVFPELSPPERYRQLGRLVVLGIRNTTVGKAVEVVLRVIGPARSLGRMNRNFRTSDNFSQAEIVTHGPRDLEVRVNEVMDQPTYMQGIIETIVELAGGKSGHVEIREVVLPAAVYRVTWS